MDHKFKVGDIVRIKPETRLFRPWTLTNTLIGDMVIVKVKEPPSKNKEICEPLYEIERADGRDFVSVHYCEPYSYEREIFYEDDLELIEGRRF